MAGWEESTVVYIRLEDQVEVESGRQRLIAGLKLEVECSLARESGMQFSGPSCRTWE
jgi:hypothetical protein